MGIEMTRNMLESLCPYNGTIHIEGENQDEIVIRISFDEYVDARSAAEEAYNHLFTVDDVCEN